MKRLICAAVIVLSIHASAVAASEGPVHNAGALGFHTVDAPLGLRYWFSDKLALDAGFGIGSTKNTAIDQNLSHWAFDIGVPIRLTSFDRVHFILRPGVVMRSQDVVLAVGPPVRTDTNTSMTVTGEFETEVFLADNFSVSASQGIAIVNSNPAVGPSTTDWATTGGNFTTVGFHIYAFGPK